MDPVKDFFRKYGAVPADNQGPRWGEATVEALLVHFRGLVLARRSHRMTPPNHKALAALLADLSAVAGELWKRVGAMAEECARQPADWPGRHELGKALAELAMSADVLRVEAK